MKGEFGRKRRLLALFLFVHRLLAKKTKPLFLLPRYNIPSYLRINNRSQSHNFANKESSFISQTYYYE